MSSIEFDAWKSLQIAGRIPFKEHYSPDLAKQGFYSGLWNEERKHWSLGLALEPPEGEGLEVGKIDWTVQDFAAKGLVLLAAEGGSGKSSFLYLLADAVQRGELFLDQFQTQQGRVLIWQADETRGNARRKWKLQGLDRTFDIRFIQTKTFNQETWDTMMSEIKSCKWSIHIFDSITTLFVVKELADAELNKRLYHLTDVLEQYNQLGIAACHLTKPDDKQLRETVNKHHIGGRSTLISAVTDYWTLCKPKTQEFPEHFNLVCAGKRNCEEGRGFKLQGNKEDFLFHIIESFDGLLPQEKLRLSEKLLTYFSGMSEYQKITDISKAIGTDYEVARRVLIDLYSSGSIDRIKSRSLGKGRPSYLYGPIKDQSSGS